MAAPAGNPHRLQQQEPPPSSTTASAASTSSLSVPSRSSLRRHSSPMVRLYPPTPSATGATAAALPQIGEAAAGADTQQQPLPQVQPRVVAFKEEGEEDEEDVRSHGESPVSLQHQRALSPLNYPSMGGSPQTPPGFGILGQNEPRRRLSIDPHHHQDEEERVPTPPPWTAKAEELLQQEPERRPPSRRASVAAPSTTFSPRMHNYSRSNTYNNPAGGGCSETSTPASVSSSAAAATAPMTLRKRAASLFPGWLTASFDTQSPQPPQEQMELQQQHFGQPSIPPQLMPECHPQQQQQQQQQFQPVMEMAPYPEQQQQQPLFDNPTFIPTAPVDAMGSNNPCQQYPGNPGGGGGAGLAPQEGTWAGGGGGGGGGGESLQVGGGPWRSSSLVVVAPSLPLDGKWMDGFVG